MSKGGGGTAAGNAAQTSANTQAATLNQIQQLIAKQEGTAGNMLAPIIGEIGGTGSNSLSQYLQYLTNPQALAGLTGVNAPGLVQSATSYLNNPGATNLAQVTPGALSYFGNTGGTNLAQVSPQLLSFYQNEMLNPSSAPGFQQGATGAFSGLQQNFAQSLSDIMKNTGPGGNPNGAIRQAQNDLLSQSTNLGSQLAQQEVGISQAGAQGVGATAGALDTQQMQMMAARLAAATGLDQQTAQMLLQGAQLGTGYNESVLSQQGSGMSTLLNSIFSGLGLTQSDINALSGISTNAGNEAFNYAQLSDQEAAQQSQADSAIWSGILGAAGTAFGGPAGGAGGSMLGRLFGGGGGGPVMYASGGGGTATPWASSQRA